MQEKIKYPIRINRYLALKGVVSRREADELIKKGLVLVNDKKAILGDKVLEEDEVRVNAKSFKQLIYLAYNKPIGIVTHSPQANEQSIQDVLQYSENVFPLGRLDKNSWGLIILTNDGRVTDRLLNPEHNHEKEYRVRVDKPLKESFVNKMSKGVLLEDGYKTKECNIKLLNDFLFSIILTEGKKRQIRRMCTALGYAVIDLKRVRIMNIKIKNIKSGQVREIKGNEQKIFLKSLELN